MNLKLSEAIRLGSMMKPQAYTDAEIGASCALEAACEAIGLAACEWVRLDSQYPILDRADIHCPLCSSTDDQEAFEEVVYHLNDDHKWSRERIADFVETIENQQASPVLDQQITEQIEA